VVDGVAAWQGRDQGDSGFWTAASATPSGVGHPAAALSHLALVNAAITASEA
jgi:hypothetical protein